MCKGLSLDLLQGAREALHADRCVALKIEVKTERLWADQYLASDVDDYLDRHGYVLPLCDFEYDHQFNVVYVRKDLIDDLERLAHRQLFRLSQSRTTWPQKIFNSGNDVWRSRKRV